jgi:cell division protein FtsZ
MRLVSNDREGVLPDYRDMDRPAVYRKGAGMAAAAQAVDHSGETDLDYLDIPAFLRRQAD